jgi:hypothetical protein
VSRNRLLPLLASALLVAAGCGRGEARLPDGVQLSGDGAALRAVADRLAGLVGTPLGRAARTASGAMAGCVHVSGHVPESEGGIADLSEALVCADPSAEPAWLVRARAQADWILLAPVGRAQRAIVRGTREADGSLALSVTLDPAPETGLGPFLLPGERAAGSSRLAVREALLHARVRPRGGMDLAALVPEGGQADRLFRLKSGLLSGALLAGVWEIAVYMPPEGMRLPPLAAALDVRNEALAVEAMERFIAELSAHWPVHRTPARFPNAEGACLFDLRILPEFAPCYVIRPGALVFGWNPESLRQALAGESVRPEEATSRLSLRLDRLPEADRRLAAADPRAAVALRDYGWRALEITPGEHDAELRVRLLASRSTP